MDNTSRGKILCRVSMRPQRKEILPEQGTWFSVITGVRALLLAACLLAAGVPALGAERLHVAVDASYPPMAYVDAAGRLRGFNVDIAHAICQELGAICELRSILFEEMIPGIVAGDVQMAVAGAAVTEQRQSQVDFTDKYYRAHSVFVERAAVPSPDAMPDVRGKRVGVQLGTIQEAYLRTHYATVAKTIVPRRKFLDVIADLQQGRTDLILVEGLPVYACLKTPEGVGLEVVGQPLRDKSLAVTGHIMVSREDPQLRARINAALEALVRSGEYARINRAYFDFSIY